jgi:cytochrome P450
MTYLLIMRALRPPATLATRIFSSDGRNITTGAYGPFWRLLRRNLTGKILHPSSVRRYAAAGRSAAEGLVDGITTQMLRGEGEGEAAGIVVLDDLLHRAVFHVLISMCFGVGLDDGVVASIASLQKEFLSTAVGFQVFGAHPSALTKLLFRGRYEKMLSIRRRHEELFVPLIRARRARHAAAAADNDDAACYVDSLLDLTVSEDDVDGGGRRNQLTESEIVSLCTEFLSGGADSTITALQ